MKRHYFQKLLHDPRGGWMQLPVFTRGIGAEILRRLDPAGGIDLARGSDPMESLLSAVAAHPRERRRVREVMQELIDGGWLVLSGRRWEAYLPDLERARPCAEMTPAGAETAVSGSQPVASVRSLGAQNELSQRNSTNDVSQGEERRKREEGEETRAREEPTERGADPPLRRLRKEFGDRWSRKTAITFSMPSKHIERAVAVAADFALKPPHELTGALDAFFATTDPFVLKSRWALATWLNDPTRWLAGTDLTVVRLRPEKHDAAPSTEITDDLFFRGKAHG